MIVGLHSTDLLDAVMIHIPAEKVKDMLEFEAFQRCFGFFHHLSAIPRQISASEVRNRSR